MRYSPLFIVFAIWIHTHLSYSSNIIFNNLSVQDGLSQMSVISLYQDENESIWMGTFSGANIYNGRFFSYLSQSNNKHSIHGNEIKQISGNKKGEVYLLGENGISIVYLKDYSVSNIWNSKVNTIYMGDSILWAGVNNKLYILKSNNLQQLDIQPDIDLRINAILEDAKGLLYIATNEECVIMSPLGGKKINLPIRNGSTFCKSKNGNVWLGTTDSGAYLLNSKGDIIKHINTLNGLSNNYIRSIVENDNEVWIGTFWGLNKLSDDGRIQVHINSLFNKYSLSHNSVYALLEDKQDNLWIGTYYGGVNYFNRHNNDYEFFDLLNGNSKSLNTIIAGRMKEDKSGKLWIATDGAGLKCLNRKTGEIVSYPERFGNVDYFNNIKVIYADKNDNLWIGIHLGGMYLYKNGQFKPIQISIKGHPDLHAINIVNDIASFGDNLLLATQDDVVLYDTRSNKSSFFFDTDIRKQIGIRIQNLCIDSKNRIWIGTKSEGLSMYDLNTEKLYKFQLERGNQKHHISNNRITDVKEGVNGEIWVTTYGGGLNKFDDASSDFISYMDKNSAPSSEYLQSIEIINDSLLLLGSKSSIIVYDVQRRKINIEIDRQKGFPIEEILEKSLFITQDKQLFVTGKNGMARYSLSGLINSKTPNTNPVFDKLIVNGKEVFPDDGSGILSERVRNTTEISLNHNQSSFSIDFSAPNYIIRAQNEYEYLLDKYDDDWRMVDGNNIISYTNVPHGSYQLKLRIKNNAESTVSLFINIKAPWYLSGWAYLLYSSVIVAVILLLRHSFISRRKLEFSEMEKQQIENNNQQKLQFFTNISHEFNTPLTLILGQIENLTGNYELSQGIQNKIVRIQNNALRMKRLISELIEFRKQEQGISKLEVYEVDFELYIKQIFVSFNELANYKKINYQLEIQGLPVKVWIDAVQMEKVFYNILFNAFKFTCNEGEICLRVLFDNGFVQVSVTDNGEGIKKEDMSNIFNRFFQSAKIPNEIKPGFGIGLALAKNIITLHGGEIWVESEEGVGSCFSLKLLYDNVHYEDNQIHDDEWILENIQTDRLSQSDDYDVQLSEEKDSGILLESRPIGDGPTVLIVEDNDELRLQLKSIFEHNYSVLLASNGKEGVEKAKENSPDIIVSDVMMPEMSGVEMCVKLKSDFHTSHIPIILLTAMNSQEHMIEGLKNGADDYIAKPFSNRVLLLKCANIINSRRRMQDKFSADPSSFRSLELATNELDKEFLQKIEDFLEGSIENPTLDVSEMAQHMCMSRSAFYNKIKSLTGQTPLDIINNYRYKKTIEILLANPQISMLDLSVRVGFNSPKYFSKSFKAHYGCTPHQYIKKILNNR